MLGSWRRPCGTSGSSGSLSCPESGSLCGDTNMYKVTGDAVSALCLRPRHGAACRMRTAAAATAFAFAAVAFALAASELAAVISTTVAVSFALTEDTHLHR